ncbi:MAG: hypothetical protein H6867_06695 [Rhodospirillales bacterium]|nr:hypothetical protein [Rhodospirillales bacterium]MCB9995237.1 hypothetical protein [Rhodospirillales bacterium]
MKRATPIFTAAAIGGLLSATAAAAPDHDFLTLLSQQAEQEWQTRAEKRRQTEGVKAICDYFGSDLNNAFKAAGIKTTMQATHYEGYGHYGLCFVSADETHIATIESVTTFNPQRFAWNLARALPEDDLEKARNLRPKDLNEVIRPYR